MSDIPRLTSQRLLDRLSIALAVQAMTLGLVIALIVTVAQVKRRVDNPTSRTVTVTAPASTCERALQAKVLTTENALQAALKGHLGAARHLFLGDSLTLPKGCGT